MVRTCGFVSIVPSSASSRTLAGAKLKGARVGREGFMAKRLGFGSYQYELVEGWPKTEIRGAVADVAVDSQGRVYAGVRNPQPDGSVGVSSRGVGHVVILDRDGREVGNWGDFAM